ncbi:MAG: DUF305 domain-containing protein [Ornithinimicrobium sp.]|uniref:DUF305 domain-containing protein n=1 Tax=Ornithinimicrobium sp. TaxID=1977084 RepID=UPI003D9AB892
MSAAGAGRGRPLVLVLGAALALAVTALVVGLMLQRPPADDSVEAGFARDMSEHHAQAVAMSMEVIQDSESKDIDVLAYDIATSQSNQIGRMQGWLEQWGLGSARSGDRMEWMPDSTDMTMETDGDTAMGGTMSSGEPGSPDYRAMPGMASLAEMDELGATSGEQAEVLFLQMMITHHVAGVEMAQAAVDEADDPQVVQLAQAMVAGQQSEIDLMVSMLADRDAEPREDLADLG